MTVSISDRRLESLVTMQRVLIAEDHPLFREGLTEIAELLADGVTCHAVENCDEMLAAIEDDDSFDLILLDYFLPSSQGFNALMDIRAKAPSTPVVVISSLEDGDIIRQAMALGVAGYLPKSVTREVMLTALRLVIVGGTYFPTELLERTGRTTTMAESDDETGTLTSRQMSVLRLMAHGKSNKEIARELGISQETVKAHISAILRRLNCTTRTQAVMSAHKLLA